MKNFWDKLSKPFVMLAPMAGYTDTAFRLICRESGADVVMTELVSADAVAHGKFKNEKIKIRIAKKELNLNRVQAIKNQSTADLLSFFEEERPLVVQLFGKNSENFAKAAQWISNNLKPDGIDINMGCPARKVVGSDHGAALLKNPELAVKIIQAVKENCDCPVSVKTRLGWERDDQILEIIPSFIGAGINAITIHGRTYKDGFKGKARWENIYKVKEKWGNKLIVVGNGDIVNYAEFKSHTLNLDGIAIGRATFGNPTIFRPDPHQTIDNLKETILLHALLAFKTKKEHGIVEFRKHLLAYLKGFPEAKKLRMEAVHIKKLGDITKIVNKLKRYL